MPESTRIFDMVSHPHDLLVRNVLGETTLAGDFLHNYLPPPWVSLVDCDSLEREPTESVDRNLSELLCDLRFSARFKGGDGELKVFVFLEHQSRPDPLMSFRLHEYVCAAYRQLLATTPKSKRPSKGKKTIFPYPLAVVLHHGKTPWKKLLPMRELIDMVPGADPNIMQLPICLVDLARIPPDELRGHPMVRALLDSLQSASNGRLGERIPEIFGRLRGIMGTTDPEHLKSWVVSLATYYGVVQTRMRSGIQDITHALTNIYSRKEAGDMALTIAESLMREGLAKGKVEGKVEGKIESTISALELRFGEVPADLKEELGALQRPKQIEKAFKLAITSQSLAEFRKKL